MKRLRYVPGMISLIGLVIALPLFYKKNLPAQQRVLTSYIVKECLEKDSPFGAQGNYGILLLKCKLEKDITKRRQIRFTLNEIEIEKKLKIIRHEALKLKYTEDTSTVIVINLNDSISYGDFVSLVDLCEADGHKRYASWDNKFVIFGEWPKVKKQTTDTIQFFSCGSISYKEQIDGPGFLNIISKEINKLYTPQGSYLLLGWLALLFTFLIFKRRNSILKKY